MPTQSWADLSDDFAVRLCMPDGRQHMVIVALDTRFGTLLSRASDLFAGVNATDFVLKFDGQMQTNSTTMNEAWVEDGDVTEVFARVLDTPLVIQGRQAAYNSAFGHLHQEVFEHQPLLPIAIDPNSDQESVEGPMEAETLPWPPGDSQATLPYRMHNGMPQQLSITQIGETVFSIFMRAPHYKTIALSVVRMTTFQEICDRYADIRGWWGAVVMVGHMGMLLPSSQTLWGYNFSRDTTFDIAVVLNGGASSGAGSIQDDAMDISDVSSVSIDLSPLAIATSGRQRAILKQNGNGNHATLGIIETWGVSMERSILNKIVCQTGRPGWAA
jgi:hypothetical protein